MLIPLHTLWIRSNTEIPPAVKGNAAIARKCQYQAVGSTEALSLPAESSDACWLPSTVSGFHSLFAGQSMI